MKGLVASGGTAVPPHTPEPLGGGDPRGAGRGR
jgi:hypothetical protein